MTFSQPESRHKQPEVRSLFEDAAAQSADLLDALVAAYALMAHADGEVAAAERRRLFSTLREMPVMSVFSREELVEKVAAHEANFRLDPEVAQEIALEMLRPVIRHAAAVRAIVTLCRALVPADGVAHPAEYRTLAEIKALLGYQDLAGAVHPPLWRS